MRFPWCGLSFKGQGCLFGSIPHHPSGHFTPSYDVTQLPDTAERTLWAGGQGNAMGEDSGSAARPTPHSLPWATPSEPCNLSRKQWGWWDWDISQLPSTLITAPENGQHMFMPLFSGTHRLCPKGHVPSLGTKQLEVLCVALHPGSSP